MQELVTRNVLPTVVAERLEAWATEARAAMSPNTQRAYVSDSAAFATWCTAHGETSLPASPQVVATFLRAEAETKSTATVRRRAATISRLHQVAGLPNPCADELVKLALKGIAKSRSTDQRQAAPLTERDTVTIRARLGDRLKDARDLALVLAGRDLLARASELVALQVADIEWLDAGALVSLRRRKTSTEARTYFIGKDAAQALRTWLERAGIADGVVFQSLTAGGRATGLPLDARDVRRIAKDVAKRAGLSHADGVSGHSMRVGMAQDLVAADLDIAAVMQAGGWASPTMVARYTEKIGVSRGAVARYYRK